MPFVIGIAGGSGCGKSTVAERVMATVPSHQVAFLSQDNYYKDQSHLDFADRLHTNYDHPNAFDWTLLLEHVQQLSVGQNIEMPIYDFAQHTRACHTQSVNSCQVIVVEGIFALYDPTLREQMHLKIFVDTDADVRFIRRLQRDTVQRGRSVESIVEQYLHDVRPMHLQFVEPTKRYADVVVLHGGYNQAALDLISARLLSLGV